jgi:diguanylate cyclase (GGDEF)-like protein
MQFRDGFRLTTSWRLRRFSARFVLGYCRVLTLRIRPNPAACLLQRSETDLRQEDTLAAVLSEFARTLITDFPIQRILDHLVDRIVDILPISSAGVTLISEGSSPRYIAASDDDARRFERLQTELDEGPCLLAYHSGVAIAVPDLAVDNRFGRFAPAASAVGLGAVFTFPLNQADERFGALDLYRAEPGELSPEAMTTAQTLADVVAAYLLNAESRDRALAMSDQFQHDAMHDTLTGLPNRLLLQERLNHAASRAKRIRTCTAILFLDLDRFKEVNDTYGHDVGDRLLIAVSHRLTGLIRASDTLARFSGDEFVFLCEEVHGSADVAMLAKRIDETFTRPFHLSGVDISVRASIGSAFVGPGEDITSELLVRADMAMYRAKRKSGGGPDIIDLGGNHPATDEQSLEADLRAAFKAGELDVAYQPIMRNADHTIVGVEALLRWNHTYRGPIPPAVVVPLAERSELMVDIGAWILERACDDHARWSRAHLGIQLELSVNVSVRQLTTPGYCLSVTDILARTEMKPESLILELTERVVTEDSATTIIAVLLELKNLGVRLALDDFGTGASSLRHLGKLPIQIVKLDQGLIAELDDSSGRIVAAGVTNIAHALGLAVVAEGVETEFQEDKARAVGCDFAQGYFFAHPMTSECVDDLLLAHHEAQSRHSSNCPT